MPPEACPTCQAIEIYAYTVPGGGVQIRCVKCQHFLDWQERPKQFKSKKGEK